MSVTEAASDGVATGISKNLIKQVLLLTAGAPFSRHKQSVEVYRDTTLEPENERCLVCLELREELVKLPLVGLVNGKFDETNEQASLLFLNSFIQSPFDQDNFIGNLFKNTD